MNTFCYVKDQTPKPRLKDNPLKYNPKKNKTKRQNPIHIEPNSNNTIIL